jgi:uncharacterized protein (DUF1501 family)
MDRRSFLQGLGLAGLVGLGASSGLLGLGAGHAWGQGKDRARVLLLVELAGGNDGLNTVVPQNDPRYKRLRPTLGLGDDELVGLSREVALHHNLGALMPAWESGQLAVVQGVGYPNPNRSHFRSIEIWETGSESDEFLGEGWLAQLWGQGGAGKALAAEGVVLGDGEVGALAGPGARAWVMEDPEQFTAQAKRLKPARAPQEGKAPASLKHLLAVQEEVSKGAKRLEDRWSQRPKLGARFPSTPLGRSLEVAAGLIVSGVEVPVVKVTHGGFDTHARQRATHDRLLLELAEGLEALREALHKAGRWDDVLVMTYSEFGRRASENASGGTDHGTAAPQLLMGGAVKGGLYGQPPSLEDLDGEDLRYTVDFRSLYTTVAQEWWGMRAPQPLQKFRPLGCVG